MIKNGTHWIDDHGQERELTHLERYLLNGVGNLFSYAHELEDRIVQLERKINSA